MSQLNCMPMISSQRYFLHIVRNSVDYDSRVLKETGALLRFSPNFNVLIAGFSESGSCLPQDIGGRILKRFSLVTRKLPKNIFFQLIKYLEWHFKIICYYSKYKISIVHCHDLETLAIGIHLKFLTGAKLIYDAHELQTERNGLSGARKLLASIFEQYCVKFSNSIITVSPSILAWYKQRYSQIPIYLVRNVPNRIFPNGTNERSLRNIYNVSAGELLFIYLGGISKGRGVESILFAFSDPCVKHHVLFMGSGPMLDKVIAASDLNPRIHYRKPVPPNEVTSYIRSADVGLCLIEDICLSYRYCLPNKLFEGLIAGLPVLASNLPDQSQLITKYNAGWVVNPDSYSIRHFLSRLTSGQVEEIRVGLSDRTSILSWENEQLILLDVYNRLLVVNS